MASISTSICDLNKKFLTKERNPDEDVQKEYRYEDSVEEGHDYEDCVKCVVKERRVRAYHGQPDEPLEDFRIA